MGLLTPLKAVAASAFAKSGLSRGLLSAQRRLMRPYARAVNYHDVPPSLAGAFEEQLRFYRKHFVSMGPRDLRELLAGCWEHDKPGLILSFDDGLRSHAEVVAPALEELGLTGWFMVPVGFVDTPIEAQRRYARDHQIQAETFDGEDRIAMSWDELRQLDGRHVVGCHTYDHVRLAADLTEPELQRQIGAAKVRLEEGLGRPVKVFAWVGGEEWSYSSSAAEHIRNAGFEHGFMTNNAPIRPGSDPLQLQRTNVEAHDPDALLRFSLSGCLDLYYTPKRKRVNRLTRPPGA